MKKIAKLLTTIAMLGSLVGCVTKKTSSTSSNSSTSSASQEDEVSKTRLVIICHGYIMNNNTSVRYYCNTEAVLPGDIVAINPKEVATVQVIPMGTYQNHYHLAVSFYID